jgi:hypothetical protein
VNLNKSITHLVDLKFQDIFSTGSRLSQFQNISDTFQADSNSIIAAIRYLNKPFGGAGYQLSLTGAYKNYLKVSDSHSYGFAVTGVKNLGQGFDLLGQYQGQWRDSALADFQSNGVRFENTVEVGLAFNFDTVFNRHLSPRRSLLNQQHQYIPN